MGLCCYCQKRLTHAPSGKGRPYPVEGVSKNEADRGICDDCQAKVDKHGGFNNWPKAVKDEHAKLVKAIKAAAEVV